ncbi:MAG: DUF3015 domain-containing protein [Aquisalinus sp.]|nr:DUF3015 domain-containing protein [Aquisalinus sp.]
MIRLISTIVASAAVIVAGTASAQNSPMRDAPNPWLDCGIGAMIFPDDNLELGAGISNIIWDLGTTAVTSAASSPDTCSGLSNVRSAMFIQKSYAQLETEIARGEGENLTALSSLAGCSAETQPAFVQSVRQSAAQRMASPEFETMSYNQKSEALYYASEEAAAVCQA